VISAIKRLFFLFLCFSSALSLNGQDAGTQDDPIVSDIRTIMDWDQNGWRKSEYELFRWDRFPSVLILDTIDYALQSSFFRRLAFFVEKSGYRGRLLTDSELKNRHGWNAHDYRTEDLALFYQTARDAEFPLSEQETELFKLLVDQGLLMDWGERISPGEGAILSISRESPEYLRYLFMIHELWHGFFFASSEYRRLCFEYWKRLDERDIRFWKIFLRANLYDSESYYLLVNEFQAYMLQQPVEDARDYYISRVARLRITEDEKAFMADYMDVRIDSFETWAQDLESIVRKLEGFEAGNPF